MSNVMGIYVKFWLIYHADSPIMVMSGDPISKNFNIGLIFHLVLGKSQNFSAEKLSTSAVMSRKHHRGRANTPNAFRVNQGVLPGT